MFELLESYSSFLFVAIGSACGAVLRMYITRNLYSFTNSRFSGILVVNLIATFFLGLFFGMQNKFDYMNSPQPLFLILCVGFLGSLSTFSSLVLELFSYSAEENWMRVLYAISTSLILGIIFAALGYHLVNV